MEETKWQFRQGISKGFYITRNGIFWAGEYPTYGEAKGALVKHLHEYVRMARRELSQVQATRAHQYEEDKVE